MNKPLVSIITPGIRHENWEHYYDSIYTALSREFELIIIGPYALPERLQKAPNVKYIKDYGTSVRCFDMGVAIAEGKYIITGADDITYIPGKLDELIDNLEQMPENKKNIVTAKYTEAGDYQDNGYYLINSTIWTSSPHVPNDWYIFNCMIMHTEYFLEMGGLDCSFEGFALALTDFAIRCYRDGAIVRFLPTEIEHVAHEGATGGTHAPMYYSFIEWDSILYKQIHDDPNSVNRVRLDFNAWKTSPSVWTRRFGNI